MRSMREACGRSCPQKEKEERERGVRYGDEAWESRADRMPGKGKAHNVQGRRVRHDVAATRKQGVKGLIQTAFAGHVAK